MKTKSTLFAAALLALASHGFADTYYLKATADDSDTSDPWRTEGIWTNATGEAYSITASGEGADVDDNEFAVGPNVLLRGRWGSGTHTVFPGKTLTLISSSSSVFNPRSVKWTIPNLIVDTTSAAADAVVIDSNGAGFNLGAENAEAITIEGTNLTIKTKSDHYAVYDIHGGGWTRNFKISSPLTGSGNLMLRTRWEGDSTATKNFYLTGDNSRFTGRLCITGYSEVKPVAWLHVTDVKQLGGNPGTLQQRGLELYRIANMKFTGSDIVVDQPNRGLYINQPYKGDTGAKGRIDVESGRSVVYTGPWSFDASDRVLSKYGYGSLYLSGGLYPGGTPGWFQIYYGVLKLNAQDFNMQNTAKVEKNGGILQIGSNGVARINNAYVKYTGSLELVDTATLELFKSGNVDYVPITTNAILNSGTTLSCPSNGTVTASKPALVVKGGSTLDFTLHGPSDTVKLALSIAVTLDATAENPVKVKLSAADASDFVCDTAYVLVSGGGFPDDVVASGKIGIESAEVAGNDVLRFCRLSVDSGNLVVRRFRGLSLTVR